MVSPSFEQNLIALRREFHRCPEAPWTEFRTTARIVEELEKLGLPVRFGRAVHCDEKRYAVPSSDVLEACLLRAKTEIDRPDLLDPMAGGYTGCITEICGALDGPTVGIRVDIDCVELQESADPSHKPAAEGFASLHPQCMHACGHDAHAAIGIGIAQLLCAHRDKLHGKVVLIFQPGEEGLRGGASMTAAGAVADCDYLFGAHVGIRSRPTGTVAAGVHGILASTKFDVLFHGLAAHAGISPERGRNAIAAAATAIPEMLELPQNHKETARLNVGTFHGGSGRNVVPAEAVLTVETRGETSAVNESLKESAFAICERAAEKYGCTCEFRFMGGADSIVCDPALVQRTAHILSQVQGVTEVLTDANFGGCEDVTAMMQEVQSHGGMATELVFFTPLSGPHHNDRFDIDEAVIPLAARCLANIALSLE